MSVHAVNSYRVLAWNPRQQQWTVRSEHSDPGDAAAHAQALRFRQPRLRVRVDPEPVTRPVLMVKPPVNNPTRAWRLDQAAAMSDRRDSTKRYKSPG